MITKSLYIILIALSIASCASENTKEKEGSNEEGSQLETADIYNSEGYKQMKQKCFICHFEKPDPSKRDSMLAPPFLRIQEHYKPTYPNKEEFINAVTTWVNEPSEASTLMPGAIRKFNLMPKLPYDEADLRLIAATLYDIDFGEMPKMGMGKHNHNGVQLNDGKKWKLNDNSIEQVELITIQLNDFYSDDVDAYNQLGRDVFDSAKMILLDESYSDELFDQLHNFFNGIEGNMHLLIAANSLEEARKQQNILKNKFAQFPTYFD